MAENTDIKQYKFLFVGETKVGKTDIVYRIRHHKYNTKEDGKMSTIGVDFVSKDFKEKNKTYTLKLWDTSGSLRFRSITKSYFRNAIGLFLCFDLTRKSTFDTLDNWMSDAKNLCDTNYRVVLLGNKSDLINEREVSQEDINKFVEKYSNITYFPCSAKTGYNIFESLFFIIRQLNDVLTNNNKKKEKLR